MLSKQTHLSMVNDRLPAQVVQYFTENKADELQSIFKVQRAASLFARPGAILRLRLENFLTHRDKTIDFQKPITLIHGQNGSGKSSVLQAIHFLICGNPRKIRDNISSVSELKTQLLVKGQDATVPAPMMRVTGWFWNGSAVVAIMRQHEQTTTYKANSYDPKDRFHLIKPIEAELLFRQMGHFPNNSATMISQTAMKNLARMTPSRRYEVFQEASLLDQIEENSRDTLSNFDELMSQTEQGRQISDVLGVKIKEVQKRLNDNQVFVEMVGQAAGLQLEIMAFNAAELLAGAQEQETREETLKNENLAPATVERAQLQARIQDCQNGLQEHQSRLFQMEQNKLAQQQVVDNIILDLAKQQMVTTRVQVEHTRTEAELNQMQISLQITLEQIGKAQRKFELMDVVPFIATEPEVPREIAEFDRRLGQIDVAVRQVTTKLTEAQNARQHRQQQSDEYEREYQQHNILLDQKNNQLRELKNQLQYSMSKNNIKQQILNSLARDDRNAAQMVAQRFQNACMLSSSVYLNSDAEQYSSVVRRFISQADLAQFVIFGQGEADLVRAVGKAYKVITVNKIFQGKQLPNSIAGVDCIPLISILNFENDYSKTALLMLKHIDNVIIIQSIKDADRILEQQPNLIVLPVDADCYLQQSGGATASKPIKERLYRDQAGGSVLYVQARDNVKAIEQRIAALQEEIENTIRQGQQFVGYEAKVQQMQNSVQEMQQQERQIILQQQQEMQNYDVVKQQKFKVQQTYQRELDTYNNKKREHEDYIFERQALQQSIEKLKQKGEVLRQDIPKTEDKKKAMQQEAQQEVNKLAALKKIQDENIVKLNSIKIEIQAQRELLEQNFDENALRIKLQACETRIDEFERRLKEVVERKTAQYNDYLSNAEQTFDAAKRLPQQTLRIRGFLQKAQNAKQFVQMLTDNIEKLPSSRMRQQIGDRRKQLYEALSVLQATIAQRQADFKFDFEAENTRLTQLMNEFQGVQEQLARARIQASHVMNAVACQQIKLSTLRKRAEKETVAAFSRQCQLLQIDLSLEFRFNALVSLWDRCVEWSKMVDQQIQQQYMSVFDNSAESHTGAINISAQRRDISSLSGGEQTFVALSFIMALCRVIQTAYLQIDEWDVFMDAKRRDAGFRNIARVIGNTLIQTVLVTPNDVDMGELDSELQAVVGVVRMDGVERGT